MAEYIKMNSGDRLKLKCSFEKDSLIIKESENGRNGCPISFVDEAGNKLCLWMSEKFNGTQELIDELNIFDHGDLIILSFGPNGYSVELAGGDEDIEREEAEVITEHVPEASQPSQVYNPQIIAPTIKKETKSSSIACSKDLVVAGILPLDRLFSMAIKIEEFVKTNKHENIARIMDYYGGDPVKIEYAMKDIGERTGVFFNLDTFNGECFFNALLKYSTKHIHEIILMIKGIE